LIGEGVQLEIASVFIVLGDQSKSSIISDILVCTFPERDVVINFCMDTEIDRECVSDVPLSYKRLLAIVNQSSGSLACTRPITGFKVTKQAVPIRS